MDSSKHTPTPWHAVLQPDGRFDIQDGPDANTASVLCTRFEWSERKGEMHANAEFIVRACNAHDDLLAALIGILPEAEANHIGGPDAAALIAAARAAIAKATAQ